MCACEAHLDSNALCTCRCPEHHRLREEQERRTRPDIESKTLNEPIPLLVDRVFFKTLRPTKVGEETHSLFKVVCRDCGDVTQHYSSTEDGGVSLRQATLYATRHLTRHLEALAKELSELAR